MTMSMTTSPPEVNRDGLKRWYVGKLEGKDDHVFLFESTPHQREKTGCTKFMVRTFNHSGALKSEQFFDRAFNLNRYLKRLMRVDAVIIAEEEPVRKAA